MRRKKQVKHFEGHIKDGLNESGLLQRPAETITSHLFEKLVFGGINLTTVLLLCPFSWRSIILEVIILVLAILLLITFARSRRSQTRSLALWTVAIIMLFSAAICPFIVAPKPVYIAVAQTENPFASKMRWLKSGPLTIGSIMLISDVDFVRKHITSILNSVFPTHFRILERTDYGNGSYYRLPVFTGFIIDSKEPGQIAWKRSVYFPCDPFMREINVTLSEPHIVNPQLSGNGNLMDFRIETEPMGLVNFTYTQYPDTIPWDCVRVPSGQEVSIVAYVALLDHALECFACGKTLDAINGLEVASAVIPISNLEAARVASLQYVAAKIYLGGNIGEIQSLPYLHTAYELFLNSQSDPRFSQRDPLTNWLRRTLLDGYDGWDWSLCFFDRISTLKGLPHTEDEQFSPVDEMRTEFQGLSYDELLKSVKFTNHSPMDLMLIRNSVYERSADRMLTSLTLMATNHSNMKPYEDFAEDAKKAIPVIRQVNLQLERQCGLKMDPIFIQFLDFFAYEWPEVEATANENETRKQIESLAKSNSLANDLFTSAIMLADTNIDTNISVQILQMGKKSEWWDIEYLRWFDCWSGNAISEAYHHKYPYIKEERLPFVGPRTRELISKNGLNCFIRDMDGNGRTFVPGVFCMAWYAQECGLNDYESLTNQFEAETLIPFESYLSSLYRMDGK